MQNSLFLYKIHLHRWQLLRNERQEPLSHYLLPSCVRGRAQARDVDPALVLRLVFDAGGVVPLYVRDQRSALGVAQQAGYQQNAAKSNRHGAFEAISFSRKAAQSRTKTVQKQCKKSTKTDLRGPRSRRCRTRRPQCT